MKPVNKAQQSDTLPKGWQSFKIKQLAKKVTAGGTPSTRRSEFWNGNILWMNSGEINLKKITSVSGRITQLGLKESATKMIPPYSILIALAGQGKTRGTVAINMIKLCTNQSLAAIITNDKISPYYLYHNLDFRYKELRAYSTGDGGRGGLNLKIINNIKVNFPENRLEQKRIVEVLSTWDQAIEKLEQLISAKQKQFQWLLKTLITNQQHNLNWKKVQLRDICTIKKGIQLNKLDMLSKGKYPVLNGGMSFSGYTNKWNTIENTITISEGGNSCGYVNWNIEKFWAGGHCYIINNIEKKRTDVLFLYYQLKNKEKRIMKLRVGSGLPNIQKGDIEKFPLILPSLFEQKKITNILYTAQKEIKQLQLLKQQYQKQKKGLMQKLLTGKWRLNK